ncbi:hypothetical protein EV426DRAFT_704982 [Tirmania nivea]|nr:hypothetical protein EV426DRAFT_704982 [Tirmania nivea]
MLLITLLPVVATIFGLFFTSCSHSGLKSALIPVALLLGPPAIVHYGRGFFQGRELEEVGEKQWTGTRALSRPVPCGLQIWEPPKSVWKYVPTAETPDLAGEPVSQAMDVATFEIPRGDTSLTRTLTRNRRVVTTTTLTTEVTVAITTTTTTTLTTEVTVAITTTTTTIMTAAAEQQPTQAPKNISARAARTPVDVICELFGRRFENLVLAIVRPVLVWCFRAIFLVIPVLIFSMMEGAIQSLFAWLGDVFRPPYRHSVSRDLSVVYTIISFVCGWQMTMDYTQQGKDVVIVETLTPYVMGFAKWVFWAYTWAEMCFFFQGIFLATFSYWLPQTLERIQPLWALKTNAHFGMFVGAGQTCFSQEALWYPLVAGYISWSFYIAGGLPKSPMYGAWSWVWHSRYEGSWVLDLFKFFSFAFLAYAAYSALSVLDRRRMWVLAGYGEDLPHLIPDSWTSFLAYYAHALFAMIDKYGLASRAWVSLCGALREWWATQIEPQLEAERAAIKAKRAAIEAAWQASLQENASLPLPDAQQEAKVNQEEYDEQVQQEEGSSFGEGDEEYEDNQEEDGNLSGEEAEQGEYEDEEYEGNQEEDGNLSGEEAEEGEYEGED